MPTKAQRRCCERWRVCAEENGGEPLLITYLDMGTFIPDSNSNYTPPLRRAASIPAGRWWWPGGGTEHSIPLRFSGGSTVLAVSVSEYS